MCQRLISWCLDDLARRLVLKAVEPASIELSVEAEKSIHAEESDINQQWMNRQRDAERAVNNARRQYEAVDPENRLVAQSLEESWEKSLRHRCEIDEAFERFRPEREIEVTEDDIKLIRSLSQDLPALWVAESTSNADRQLIVRHLISRVSVTIVGQSEVVDVAIEWVGGNRTEHRVFRPLARYDALHDFDALKSRIIELWQEGYTTPMISEKVNASGFRTPGIRNPYSRSLIRQLLDSWGQTEPLRAQISQNQSQLEKDEWWLVDLAQDLGIANSTLARWCRRGWINARKLEGKSKWWIAWADKSERTRLKKLFKFSSGGVNNHNPYPPKLVTPKNRK